MSGIWVNCEGKQSKESQGTLYVLVLEVEGGDSTGDIVTTATMLSLWDAHASGAADKTHADG